MRAFVCTALVAMLSHVVPAVATTYTIATTVDDAPNTGNCTLREAIQAARGNGAVDACPAGTTNDVIVLPSGTYPFFGRENLLNIPGSIEIRSQTLDPTTTIVNLHVDGLGEDIFLLASLAGSLTLRGFTIENGNGGYYYSAVTVGDTALTVDRMRFVGNRTYGAESPSNLTGPSALYFGGRLPLIVSNTVFSGNAAEVSSGAVRAGIADGGTATFTDVAFVGNKVTTPAYGLDSNAGALYLFASGVGAVASCVRCYFADNEITTGAANDAANGGAAYFEALSQGLVRVVDSSFVGNAASDTVTPTGGLPLVAAFFAHAISAGTVELDRIFVDASGGTPASSARDVALTAAEQGVVDLTDAQITYGAGGGLWAQALEGGTVRVGATTLASYYTGTAATVYTSGSGVVTMQSSLLAVNHANVYLGPSANFIFTNDCLGNPAFVNEPAGDYHLAAGAAAIDVVPQGLSLQKAFDRDHRKRKVGSAIDCGAYEWAALYGDDFESGDALGWSARRP
jgi:CSLREA domain-containing protein